MNVRETLSNAWQTPELRARIIFVFSIFAVYTLGLHVSVPGLSQRAVENIVNKSGILQMMDLFSGGGLRKVSIFSLGLNPYITSSIIMQLLAVAVPSIQQMQKEGGEYGRRMINQYTRRLTILLGIAQGFGIVLSFRGAAGADLNAFGIFVIVVCWTAGAMFLLWLGEQITEKGIGNGISLLIFAGIVARLPANIYDTVPYAKLYPFGVFLLVSIFLATIFAVVMVTKGQRRIPIQHAKRVIGSRAVGGQMTYLPLSVNTAGVIPIIFAISLMMFPQQFATFIRSPLWLHNGLTSIADKLTPGKSIGGSIFYTVLIFAFTYFYTAVVYNVEDISDNLKKHGAYIPGIRPGKATQEYLDKVISRITVAGALFLAFIALMQYWVPTITNIRTFTLVGGTSLLIVVGVALDTMQQIEAQLLMRQYEGFIK